MMPLTSNLLTMLALRAAVGLAAEPAGNGQLLPTSDTRLLQVVETNCSEFCFQQSDGCRGVDDIPNCNSSTPIGERCRGRNNNTRFTPFCETNNENPTCKRPNRPDGNATVSVYRRIPCVDCSKFCFEQRTNSSVCTDAVSLPSCGNETSEGELCRGRNINNKRFTFCGTNNENPTCKRPRRPDGNATISVWERVACPNCTEFCFDQKTDESDCTGADDLPNCGEDTEVGEKCRGRNSNKKHEPFCSTNNDSPTCTRPNRPDGNATISVWERINCTENV